MAKDFIEDENWGKDAHPAKKPAEVSRPPQGGGGHSGLKDYVIVALIALIAVMGINNYIFARTSQGLRLGGGCGGGGCGGSSGSGVVSMEELRQIGLQYYVTSLGGNASAEATENLDAVAENFGCHQEIYIYQDGQLVMRLGYASGRIYEM